MQPPYHEAILLLIGELIMTKYFEWTKKLGQQHFSLPRTSNGMTMCGRPMLGNNYAKHIAEEDKVPCKECAEAITKRQAEIDYAVEMSIKTNGLSLIGLG